MNWGPYGSTSDTNLVYFGGITKQKYIALACSTHHLIGSEKGQNGVHSHSLTPYICSILQQNIPEEKIDISSEEKGMIKVFEERGDRDRNLLKGIELATDSLKTSQQKVDFFAKTLLTGPQFTLGSPIYVSLAQ